MRAPPASPRERAERQERLARSNLRLVSSDVSNVVPLLPDAAVMRRVIADTFGEEAAVKFEAGIRRADAMPDLDGGWDAA